MYFPTDEEKSRSWRNFSCFIYCVLLLSPKNVTTPRMTDKGRPSPPVEPTPLTPKHKGKGTPPNLNLAAADADMEGLWSLSRRATMMSSETRRMERQEEIGLGMHQVELGI